MKNRYHYASVIKALEELKSKGFAVDFNLLEQDIMDHPEHYEILHIYRYEGDSNPDDEAIVYGIKSNTGEKGVFVAGFSPGSESEAAKVLHDLSIKGNSH
ncbi:MAG: hypothetical protein QM710_02880 [Flavobacterium sp.]